jgi:hypothetical protein
LGDDDEFVAWLAMAEYYIAITVSLEFQGYLPQDFSYIVFAHSLEKWQAQK